MYATGNQIDADFDSAANACKQTNPSTINGNTMTGSASINHAKFIEKAMIIANGSTNDSKLVILKDIISGRKPPGLNKLACQ